MLPHLPRILPYDNGTELQYEKFSIPYFYVRYFPEVRNNDRCIFEGTDYEKSYRTEPY